MADIKNFGLIGVGNNVQFGKGGPRLKMNGAALEARTALDDTLSVLRSAPGVTGNDVVTFTQLSNAVANAGVSDGFHLNLGDIANSGDGSWSPGAIPLTDTTKVSDAVDRLNEVLGLLVPTAPSNFPNAALSVSNTSGTTPVLANNVVDNSGGGSGYTPSNSVTRIIATGVTSNTFNDVGPGESGTIQLLLNGTILGSKALTGSGDNSTSNGLVIADQKDFPVSTPGFWKSVDVSATLAPAPLGINKFKLNHTGASATSDVYFVRDNVTAAPSLSAASVTQAALGTVANSSSVPHYATGGQLTVSASISNLAGQTYYGGSDPFVVSGVNTVITSNTFNYAGLGIATPINSNTTVATAISPVTINVDGSLHGMGVIQGVARNVNGATSATNLSSTIILVKRGAAGAKIDELSVPVTGLGSAPNANNAVRITLSGGDKPSDTASAWSNSATLPTYETTVVGGILKHDQTNYSSGYLPVGPNLSTGRTGAQYATFSFNRSALSTFKIVITGTYAGCWVRLPGVSDNGTISPNGGGWWDGFKIYDGAGVPGETGDTLAGCASGSIMTGTSGSFTMTFGTQSSTNATGNEIQVRFRLNAGQSISALSFTN